VAVLQYSRGVKRTIDGMALLLSLALAVFGGLSPALEAEAHRVVRDGEKAARTAPALIPILIRPGVRGVHAPGGGGGGSYTAVDALSTVVYSNPEPVRSGLSVTLPTTWLDTQYDQGGSALTWAEDVTLTDSGNAATNHTTLQTAVTASLTRVGHTRIKLPDGWVSEGVLQCGIHTQGEYWTYIQRASLGTEGTRCTPAQMSGAPILRTTVANRGAVETLAGAQRWRFDEIKFETSASQTQTILNVGPCDTNGDATGTTVSDLPTYIYFHRCWTQGKNNSTGDVVNGVTLNTRASAYVDGIVDQIWRSGVESHAIVSFTCQGPLKIVNNYLEASAITVLFGGANPSINGFVVEDVEFRRNHLTLRDSWNPFNGSWDSIARPIKNRLEFKMGVRALVEGNVIEKSPVGGQNGEWAVIKSMAGESGLNASWYKTENICLRYNKCRNLWNTIYITGVQMPHLETLGGTNRIAFHDNLVYDYADTGYGSTDNAHCIFPGDATNVQFDHNTIIPKTASITLYNPRSFMWCPDLSADDMGVFLFTNNIVHSGNFDGTPWMFTNVSTDGETELARVTTSYTLANNFVIDGPLTGGMWPSGEVTDVASIAAMNFTSDDPSLGLDGDSPAKNAATDGTDAGCNYTKVNLATSGVV
jgi:hypothetical protein